MDRFREVLIRIFSSIVEIERLTRDLQDLLRSNGFDISKLEFVKPLEKRFTCPVCQYVLLRPLKLSCGHHVCEDCLDKVFKNNDSTTCPVNVDDDCKNIKIDEVKFDCSLFDEVWYLMVKCPLTKHGCSDVMCLFQLKFHLPGCQDKIVPCKYNCGVKTKRKDILSHYEICPKKPQECEYKFYGCDFEKSSTETEDIKSRVLNNENDLNDIKPKVVTLDRKVSKLMQNNRDLKEQVNNLTLQIKNMDGAAGGTQLKFDSNNSMAGKSDVKLRGKIPSWQEEILKKNYLIIMENIKVDHIMDHLYSGNVINWNEMDVIQSKLKSDGNGGALRYLIGILLNSSHTALTSFIHCLNETGYIHIAKPLQEDIDSTRLNVQNQFKTRNLK